MFHLASSLAVSSGKQQLQTPNLSMPSHSGLETITDFVMVPFAHANLKGLLNFTSLVNTKHAPAGPAFIRSRVQVHLVS